MGARLGSGLDDDVGDVLDREHRLRDIGPEVVDSLVRGVELAGAVRGGRGAGEGDEVRGGGGAGEGSEVRGVRGRARRGCAVRRRASLPQRRRS